MATVAIAPPGLPAGSGAEVLSGLLLGSTLNAFREQLWALEVPPVLHQALTVVPSRVHSGPPLRTVRELASRVGCSASYLYRLSSDVGIDLPASLRYGTLFRALDERWIRRSSWLNVAIVCGFRSHSALSNFVRRHWGCTPTEASQRTRGEWLQEALSAVVAEPSAGREGVVTG